MRTYLLYGIRRWLVVAVAAGLGGLVLASVARVSAAPTQPVTCAWQRLASGEDRSQHSITYLPVSDAVASYAGGDMRTNQDRLSDDLHILQLDETNADWERVNLAGGPGDRMQHTAVLRQIPGGGQEMVVYGGVDSIPGGGGGTGTWKSPLLATGPRGLLGGYSPAAVRNTTHRLTFGANGDPASWASINVAGQSRADHTAVWAPTDDAMIIFGGRRSEEANTAENSLWQLTLGSSPSWGRLNVEGGPSARFAHTAVYQESAHRMIVFGGTNNWTSSMSDVWALSLLNGTANATWTSVDTTGTSPSARYDHAAVYLPGLDWMVVIGGTTNGQREIADVWALDLSQDPSPWVRLAPTGNGPPGLQGLAGTYDSTGNRAIFHGGQVGPDSRDQTWALACSGGSVETPTATATSTDTAPVDTLTPTSTEPTDETPTPTDEGEPPTETPTEEPPDETPTSTPTEGVVDESTVYLPNVRKHR